MRTLRTATGIAILGLAQSLFGQSPQSVARLEPVPAYDSNGYSQTVFQVLIKERLPELWMIAKPSFSTEYAVILGRVWSNEVPRKIVRYELRWVKARRQIWHWKQIKGTNSAVVDPLKNPGIEEKSIEFPTEAAQEISKAWSKVIKESRYSSEPNIGLDGATYEFYSHFNLFGKTWSPQSGAPALMVDLGEALIAYVKSKEGDRAKCLRQCLEISRKLQGHSFT